MEPPTARAAPADDLEGPRFGRATTTVLWGATAAVLVFCLVLRFWTRSDLWLDEALTVDIAGQPLHRLVFLLKRDGAPPLYYVLLHVWMGWFGHSDLAVRSLSGVFGVATVPLAGLAGRRLGGRTVGWVSLLLIATSPFAVRYATECRMYSLVAFLTVLGYLALDRAMRAPRAGNLIAVGVVTGLLLYTHYWSLFLVGTVVLWLAYQAWRGVPARRRGARASLAACLAGCLTFVPWVPIFLYQSAHTGTPWATPASFSDVVNTVTVFAGGGTTPARALALVYSVAVGLALFGVATDRLHVELDLRTRPKGRPVAIVVLGTLVVGIVGGILSGSTFDARYASVVFVPLILLVALGTVVILDRRARTVVVAAAVLLGLAGGISNVTTNRTQAGEVAAAVATYGKQGDEVAYCPDQLGPAVNRLLPPGRYTQSTFPRGTGPIFVDWVDYAAAVDSGSPTAYAAGVLARAGEGRHQIFLVWGPGYQVFGTKCQDILVTLQHDPHYTSQTLVVFNNVQFYQPMYLVRFAPTGK